MRVGLEGDEQAAWLVGVELELDNVRAALEFAFQSGGTALGLQIVSSLGRFWRAHGHVTEARRWLGRDSLCPVTCRRRPGVRRLDGRSPGDGAA